MFMKKGCLTISVVMAVSVFFLSGCTQEQFSGDNDQLKAELLSIVKEKELQINNQLGDISELNADAVLLNDEAMHTKSAVDDNVNPTVYSYISKYCELSDILSWNEESIINEIIDDEDMSYYEKTIIAEILGAGSYIKTVYTSLFPAQTRAGNKSPEQLCADAFSRNCAGMMARWVVGVVIGCATGGVALSGACAYAVIELIEARAEYDACLETCAE